MLELKNLNVEIEKKKILKGISKKFENGKIYALMGPNGSGKSTLAMSIMGHPRYKIKNGTIILDGVNITDLSPNKKSKKGIFLSFQQPPEIDGIPISKFLRQIDKTKKTTFLEFKNKMENNLKNLELKKEFIERYLNFGFSGGEKKKSEILQMLTLNPKIVILDEIDSGLDVDSLKIVAHVIKNFMDKNKIIIIITHYKRILDYLKIDEVLIMKNGQIVKKGNSELIKEIEKEGYKRI